MTKRTFQERPPKTHKLHQRIVCVSQKFKTFSVFAGDYVFRVLPKSRTSINRDIADEGYAEDTQKRGAPCRPPPRTAAAADATGAKENEIDQKYKCLQRDGNLSLGCTRKLLLHPD